jgi:hypothetical protein
MATDLPHASGLPLLPVDNAHVRQDLDKVPWRKATPYLRELHALVVRVGCHHMKRGTWSWP